MPSLDCIYRSGYLGCHKNLSGYFRFVAFAGKKWKQAIQATVLGLISFFVPFLFMEGENRNPFVLFNTLSKTVEQYYNNTGFGYRHDLSNIFRILGAIFDCNLTYWGIAVALISFIAGVTIVLFAKRIFRWELYAILSLNDFNFGIRLHILHYIYDNSSCCFYQYYYGK